MKTDADQVGMQMTTGIKLYLGALGLAGAGVMAGAYLLGWGFWGWFGGGLLLFAGWGALLGNHFKVGWQPAVGPCPACGQSLNFLTKKQYLRCIKCETLLEAKGPTLAVIDGQTVLPKPELPVPYVRGISFPPGCALCGEPTSQTETVRWDKHRRKSSVIVATIIEVTKLRLDVPVCDRHRGQRAVAIDYGDHPSTQEDGVAVKFRSLARLEAFRAYNAERMPAIVDEPQMPHAPQPSP